ncbi:MAG TPA: hypothetical protein VHA78_00560 [Candidatus Peribacteraceae bacterium]|nr:hypothetical protein [Candidatus Peribacteraceae bacterium]
MEGSIDRVMRAKGRMLCGADWDGLRQQLRDGEHLVACIQDTATGAERIVTLESQTQWHTIRTLSRTVTVLGYFSTPEPMEANM